MVCCGRSGPGLQTLLLDKLAANGIVLPEGAQIWGRGDGTHGWRLVDRMGCNTDPPVVCGHSIQALLRSARLRFEDVDDETVVHPD